MPVEQPLSDRKCKQSGKKVSSQDNGGRVGLTGLGRLNRFGLAFFFLYSFEIL